MIKEDIKNYNQRKREPQDEGQDEDFSISEEEATFRDLYGDDEDYINDQMEGEGSF